MAAPLICSECRQEYTMTASEKVRFQELIKSVQGFVMPKRCPACRKKNREAKAALGVGVVPAPKPVEVQSAVAPPPPPRVTVDTPKNGTPSVKAEAPAKVELPREEVRLILATKDFEDLVHGRPVVWQGVRVILADIGFKVMRDAIERAETEKAKILFHKNGSN
jgi:hypothetical protein